MKILDITEFYSERGGGVRSHLSLKSHVLCQLGHEHVIVAPGAHDGASGPSGEARTPSDEPTLPTGEGRSARVIRVRGPASPYDPSYHLLLNARKVRAIIATERPDVLEIHSPYMAALSALRAPPATFGVRTFQWHSDFIDTYGGVLTGKIPIVPAPLVRSATEPLWSLVRSIARRCDATLVASAWQIGKLSARGVPHLVHRPFGIERDVFRPTCRSASVRAEMLALAGRDASDGAALLVGVGRFAVEKRWDVVIDAFARVRDRGREAVLVLFGDGPELERMRARVRRAAATLERDVVFAGFTKDRDALAAHLASADMLVHGCPFETFGLSIAEAMSCGLPTVVPDDGGAAEMHDPASGERYASGDPEACAEAIERLLERIDAHGDALRAAAARAASRFPSVRDHFAEQIALYTDLLERRQRRSDAR